MQKLFTIIIILFAFVEPSFAQEEQQIQENNFVRGTVVEVLDTLPPIRYLTELPDGSFIELDSYGEPLRVGNRVYVEYFGDYDSYNFITVVREVPMILLVTLFVLAILFLSQKKGIRSLLSLVLSFILLFYVLVPLIVGGSDPVWVAVLFGLAILFLSIFITHGFNYQSTVSFLGSFASILIAVAILQLVVGQVSMTGFIDDYTQYLNFELDGAINLIRVISASIIIGILGVLDDITITQVSVVKELSSDHSLSRFDIFKKALNVGRDHIASLVNTLVFAYVGASLPLVLFVSLLDIPWWILISQEFMFVEIVRSLVGAIALTVAVPVTTWLAVYMFLNNIHKENCKLEVPCAHRH